MNRQQWAALNTNRAPHWPVEPLPNQRAARDSSRPVTPRPPVRPSREGDGRG